MANYLFIAAEQHICKCVRSWIGESDELRAGSLPPGGFGCPLPSRIETLYLAREGRKDTKDGVDVFKGYAVDHETSRLMFSGRPGAGPAASTPIEGCYLRIQRSGDNIEIGNDIFAQLPIMYWSERGIVAVSDSLFVLTELRKHLGLTVTIDTEVMLARSWGNAMSGQLLCERTPIEGIRFCTPGTSLGIDVSGGLPRVSVVRRPVPLLFQGGIATHRDTVIEAAERATGLIAGLTDIPGATVSLQLSGGLDSRVCLAAALHGNRGGFSVISNSARQNDMVIASALGERLGFALNNAPERAQACEAVDRLTAWFLSCCGIYDFLHASKTATSGKWFTIGGHGAEIYKGMFGWRPIARIAKLVPAVGPAFEKQCEQGLAGMGVDPADPWGSEWHYLGFRNAIHSGRSTMGSLLGVRPLLQRKLLGLSRSALNELPAPAKGAPSIVSDLLVALSPLMATMPFDSEKKSLSSEYVSKRSKVLGSTAPVDPYRVEGSPSDVASGPPAFFKTLVRRKGLAGNITATRLLEIIGRVAAAVPADLRPTYEPMVDLCRAELQNPVPVSSPASVAAGKLMAFVLVD